MHTLDFGNRLIRFSLRALDLGALVRLLPKPDDCAGFVLTLHRVRPAAKAAFDPNGHLSITPGFLDALLADLAGSGWDFVPIDRILHPEPGAEGCPKRVAITIDDAFADVSRHAIPILDRHGAPFCLFVVPGFCDGTVPVWWEVLEKIIGEHESIRAVDAGGRALPCRSVRQKRTAFRTWARWLSNKADERQVPKIVTDLAQEHRIDIGSMNARLIMDWRQIREAAQNPLCTLGAHTMSHAAVARLPDDRARWEIAESAARIRRETGTQPTVIAFPYGTEGTFGSRDAKIVQDCGLVASFTTRPGYVRPARGTQLLPRVSLNGHIPNARLFRPLLAPGLWTLQHRLAALAGSASTRYRGRGIGAWRKA